MKIINIYAILTYCLTCIIKVIRPHPHPQRINKIVLVNEEMFAFSVKLPSLIVQAPM